MISSIPRPADADAIQLRVLQRSTPPTDAQLVRHLALQTAATLLEIGCHHGDMTAELAKTFPLRTVIGVDWVDPNLKGTMCEPQSHEMLGLMQEIGIVARSLPNVRLLNRNSRELDYSELHDAFGPIDFIFIDGDHSYDGVKADTELALRYLENHNHHHPLIVWHDAHPEYPDWCGVWKYLTELSLFHNVQHIDSSLVAYAQL